MQVLRQMANDLRKETEACLQDKPGRKAATGPQKAPQQPAGYEEEATDSESSTGA